MRFYIGGPRLLGLRTGFSFGPEDFGRLSNQQSGPSSSQVDSGFLYVIRGDHNLLKIGISTNPNARLAQLRTASPFRLDFAFVCAFQGGYEVARLIEQSVHMRLAKYQTSGEWFDVPLEMAVAAIAAETKAHSLRYVEIALDQIDAVIRLAAQSSFEPDQKREKLRIAVKTFALTMMGIFVFVLIFGQHLKNG